MSNIESAIDEQDIVEFLKNDPEFFLRHPNLITDIQLPHASGNAISLIERQVSVLRDRNMEMRHRLSSLLENARDNDKLFDKTKRLVLALMEAQDLGDIVDALFYSFNSEFKIHYTTLLLFSKDDNIDAGPARIVTLNEAREPLGAHIKSGKASCGHFDGNTIHYLFEDNAAKVGSAAIAPLIHGNCFGLLAIGNRDSDYYRSSMGTLFLSYIADMLNRIVPKHLPA
ncbi:DUF484 family protein [Pseudoteredinibacter isoporae]|uniref:DUF484 family protein n=1 Tax=Pseudoteredinibacter isoporae TaxID=570281 RepID=A0A7X0JQU8_9GAMM|nr:DUF484 family protein [Pseudoteredinibacter isoporae]MBB6519968.1 hypothetical protein [Pseudoteredinibacter isoporae]NHO85540.1 DUF484 family protein [Pseudoteredinibacter isoporae]NIB26008.1 DUF484 family protein [Pseudoteredinibacter isoporae]